MSSAILYVAIVAIWAGVLIPRWLRRDSAASERAAGNLVTADAVEEPAPRPRRRDETAPAAHVVPSVPGVASAPGARPAPRPAVRPEPAGSPRDEEHKKVLSGRRRLLGMLLALAIGSGTLAYTGMAAWWVIVPPTAMVLGYLTLLREASKADAERREQARVRAPAAVAAAGRAAPPAPAPDAEVIDISASLTEAGHEFYDQYADAKKRAVGDLRCVLTG